MGHHFLLACVLGVNEWDKILLTEARRHTSFVTAIGIVMMEELTSSQAYQNVFYFTFQDIYTQPTTVQTSGQSYY